MSEMQKRILERQLVGKGIPPHDRPAAAFTMPDRAAKKEGKRRARPTVQERLPHGSNFDVTYDADRQSWTGTLTVHPHDGHGGRALSASCSGVHGLLMKLFQLYKKSLAPKESTK